ncbi:MAG: arginase family protein, partial [Pseudomonadota bacterium]|nr:arginase family protein [Pseudomonadota bacterium]
GVIWFDAHPDFDTPDEARSGYFDGMGLATLTGQCWRALAATIPGFQPMSVERLVYCGVRDFEPGQAEKVERFGVRTVCGGGAGPRDFAHALEAELERVPFREMIIHIDLDCLDTSVGQANEYSSPGGLSANDLSACLDRACRRLQPLALTVASFNPDLEGGDAIARAGVEAIETVVRRAGRG